MFDVIIYSMITIICSQCGVSFERWESRIKYGRGKYCSQKCQYEAIKNRQGKKVEFICIACEKTFFVPRSRIGQRKGIGKYCSRKCRDEHRKGENHPQYINGSASEQHGPNWHAQRRKAISRDRRTCQRCYESGFSVHHIVPFRLFGIERYIEANDLSNLITYCSPCHRIVEAEIQRNELSL